GTATESSDDDVQTAWSGVSAAKFRLRSVRDRSRSHNRRSENMLLPPYHTHVTSSGNSNHPRRSAANDSKPDQLGGYLILRAKKLPAVLPGAVFSLLEPQCTTSERVASSEGCR